MTELKQTLHKITKKYICDLCGQEFQYHSNAAEHVKKCQNYSIETDPTVKRIDA